MKFNFTNKGKDTTVNYMGAKAYKMTPEMELYSTVVTCMVDDSYYESNTDRICRIKNLIAKCSPEFVARLAVYARTEMNLRSVSMILAVELAKLYSGNEIVKRAVAGVVRNHRDSRLLPNRQQTGREQKVEPIVKTNTKRIDRIVQQV